MNRDEQRSPDEVHEQNFEGIINTSPINAVETELGFKSDSRIKSFKGYGVSQRFL